MVGIKIARWQIPQLINKLVFPVAVDAHGHGVVHDIILVGNRVEDLVD